MQPKPSKRPKPTDGELEILSVLWDRGPSTVRELHEVLENSRAMGRTTVLKLVQIMTDKGLVQRDDSARPSVFSASSGREETQGRLVDDLLSKAFNGSAESLVLHVLSGKKATPDELDAIRALLEKMKESQ